MPKKKIVFVSSKKWWAYSYLKWVSEYLYQNHREKYDIEFRTSIVWYIYSHFEKSDVLITMIPFFFKPSQVGKYVYSLHGNYMIEREKLSLGVKLLYLTENNLDFSDSILLTSYFLADQLDFRSKYNEKIIINPCTIQKTHENIFISITEPIKLLTVSSADFLDKGMWLYDIASELSHIQETDIKWDVVLPWNLKNREKIISKISRLEIPQSLEIVYHDYVEPSALSKLYQKSHIYIYWTWLETWWNTIMEAMSYWKPVVLLPYKLWEYIYPEELISNDVEESVKNIMNNYVYFSQKSHNFVKNFTTEKNINKLIDDLL